VRAAIALGLLLLAACNSAPDRAESRAAVGRFHAALNAGDWPAIDALLSREARDLRPGGGTARAFRAIAARHGRHLGGDIATFSTDGPRATLDWAAQYERGAVTEQFGLVHEAGGVRIDSYTDQR
jgi:hypothetical protein